MTQGKNLSVCCRRTKAFNKTFTRRKHEIKTWEKYKYKIAVFGTSPHGQSTGSKVIS